MSHRLSRRPLRAVCIAAVLVVAGPVPGAGAEPGLPEGESVGVLLTRLQGLYQKAEEATEAYNATDEALRAGQAEERLRAAELGKARTEFDSERAIAGRLAREQYQGAQGLSPYARMLLAGNPQAALDQRRLAAREGARRAGVLARLARGEKKADALAVRAREALDARQTLAAQQKLHKDEVAAQLKEVERVLAALTPDQLTRLGAREAENTAVAQRSLVDSGRLPTRTGTPRRPVEPPSPMRRLRSASRTSGVPRGRGPSTAPG